MAEDSIKPTPESVPVAGSLSRLIDKISGWMENTGNGGAGEPSLRAVPALFGMRAAARQLGDVAYGQSHVLDNSARGRSAREDAVAALPLAATAGKYAMKAAAPIAKALPKAGGAQMNMFIGPSAKTADLEALARAQKAEAAGKTPEEIWQNTMWMKGPDGKWRSELSDHYAKFNPEHAFKRERGGLQNRAEAVDDAQALRAFADRMGVPADHPKALEEFEYTLDRSPHPLAVPYAKNHTKDELYANGAALKTGVMAPIKFKMGDIHQHPDLYAAYPEAREMGYKMQQAGGSRASYAADNDGGTMGSINSQGSAARVDRSEPRIALHEVQHAIQRREGFDPGARDTFIKSMKALPLKQANEHENGIRMAATMRGHMDDYTLSASQAYDRMLREGNHLGERSRAEHPEMREWLERTASDHRYSSLESRAAGKSEDTARVREQFPPLDDAQALEAYHKNMGEAEARTTEARRHLTLEERRARFPMKDYDRPPESLYSQDELYTPRTRLNPENLKSSAGADRFINKIVGP